MKKFIIVICVITGIMMLLNSCNTKPVRLFAGTYTDNSQKGLYVFDLNPGTGSFKLLSEADAGPNPSYFCISKKRNLIYAADEVMEFNGVKGGGVTALKYVPETGALVKVKDLLVPDGGPCFISLSPNEDFLLMANYSSSSIAVVKLDNDGLPERVTDSVNFGEKDGKASHPHMMTFDPAGKKVYLTDLGFDRVVIYDFDATSGHLNQIPGGVVNFQAGAGPRHFVFNSAGTMMYVICELNSTISVFDVTPGGELKQAQTLSTLGEDFTGENASADIHIGRDGKYLYGSNRGENTIVIFSIGSDGNLTLAGRVPCGGDWPRNFVIDPSGKYMLVGNEKSGNIALFKIDPKSGIPEYRDDCKIETPSCLKF